MKLSCGSFVLLVFITGCGGGGGTTLSSNVTVTVSPATVTIPTSDQVTLQATVKGSSNDANPSLTWTIDELKDKRRKWFAVQLGKYAAGRTLPRRYDSGDSC